MPLPVPLLLMVHRLDLGGSERQMAEVAKALDRRLFSPHVGCFHATGLRVEELKDAGIPILQLPVTSFASPSALRGAWQMARYIWKHGIQLVHSFDVPLNIFSVPVGRLAHRPIVLSSQRAHRGLTPGFYHKMLRITDNMVDGIVVNCQYMRQHLLEDEKVPDELIHLCYNGIDTSVFHPALQERPRELEGAGTVIGVVCALRPEKGLSTLVSAFASLAPAFPEARLAIVGSGPCHGSLVEQARSLGIEQQCVFIPKTNEVTRWLRAIDIFVLPSLSEALSNSLMEAMACGCCAVASRVGGNPELVAHQERGLLFERENASALATELAVLLSKPAYRQQLAQAGKQFIHQRFTREISIQRMQEIYTSFLTSSFDSYM